MTVTTSKTASDAPGAPDISEAQHAEAIAERVKAQQAQPIQLGHVVVRDHQIGGGRQQLAQAILAIHGVAHIDNARFAQAIADQGADGLLIVDDQNFQRGGGGPPAVPFRAAAARTASGSAAGFNTFLLGAFLSGVKIIVVSIECDCGTGDTRARRVRRSVVGSGAKAVAAHSRRVPSLTQTTGRRA